MSAHTPGPWRPNFHHTHRDGGRTYAMVDDGKSIVPLAAVTLGVEGCSEDEGRANARLIAAAPDMLAALRATVAGDDASLAELDKLGVPRNPENSRLTELCRAAIRKAEGAS